MQIDEDAPKHSSFQHLTSNYPYTPSVASAASSSVSSIFSADGKSSQSSAPSSVKSGSPSWDSDSSNYQGASSYESSAYPAQVGYQAAQAVRISQYNAVHIQNIVPSDTAVAPELRLNPRRTQPSIQTGKCDSIPPTRAPPSLVRQSDRKDNFVESLVDTTTQMIEVIWPLSVIPCDRDTVLGGKNLIGLRTFIQEVLKRSKTSYSTLQVALYYLVLVKPCIPKVDFTKAQAEDSHATRAMQCGRRMFLAALILASKYLQDRNYSARAWSKISGLKVSEINANEMAFVAAVNWKLHVPEQLFQRWTDVVLKFSLSQSQSSPFCRRQSSSVSWRSIIPRLTPELDDLETVELPKPTGPAVFEIPRCPLFSAPMCPPPSRRISESPPCGELTPTPATAKPEALEPTPRACKESFRFPPISPRIPQLPTPAMTPRTNGFITPAVGVASYCRGQSMSEAMKQIRTSSFERCSMDTWPYTSGAAEALPRSFPMPVRRPSYAFSSSSTISSPESMVSDFSSSQSSCSSRTSRSSSVCSIASAVGALPLPSSRLAVQATRRCATMAAVKEHQQHQSQGPCGFLTESTGLAGAAKESYVRGFEGQDHSETAAAALALSDLACGKAEARPVPVGGLHRKRERPCSIVGSASFDAEVRALLPTNLETYKMDTDDGTVAEDSRPATSFLLREDDSRRLPFDRFSCSRVRSESGSRDGLRKRTCKEEAWSGAELTMSPFCV